MGIRSRLQSKAAVTLWVALIMLVGVACGAAATATPAAPPAKGPAAEAPKVAATPAPALTPTKVPAVVATPVPAPTSTKAPPVATRAPRGELRVALNTLGREQWDPILDSRAGHAQYRAPVFDSLLSFGGGGKIGPGVAERWELAKDGLNWTFYLRKGLVFHNGDPLTSADVKFSLERTMSKESILGEAARLRKAIKEIELIDDLTMRIHTTAVNVTFSGEMTPVVGQGGQIMPKKYIETNALDYIGKNPVGSGPWKFVRHVKGDRVEFEAWDKSYRGTPHFQRLILLLVPEESTRVAMLRTDQAYVTDITAETAKEVSNAKMQLVKIGGAAMYIFQFWGLFLPEHKDSPLNNIKVREALSLAINRQEIIDFVMEGYATIPMPFASFRNTFDLDLERWEKFSREALRYDPVKAKQLLTEAGYPQGFRVTFYTTNFPGTPFMNKISTAVTGYWEKAGVKVDLKELEFGVFSDYALPAGHRDPKAPFNGAASIYRNAGRPDAVPRYFTTFHADGNHFIFGDAQHLSPEAQEFAKLYKEIPSELDTVLRAQKFNRMVELVTSSWMAPSILEAVVLYGANPKRVGKWEGNYGRAELGDLFERIPHPDTHPW